MRFEEPVSRSVHRVRQPQLAGFAAGWGAKAAAQLEQDVRNGAIGLKIFEDLGMTTRKADGSRIAIDDPELDPVWAAAGRVCPFWSTRRAAAFFEPADYTNERWLELALFPSRDYGRTGEVRPAHRRARSHVCEASEDQIHRGALRVSRPRPQARGRAVDRLPNVYLEVAAVLYDFGRQPRAAAAFFANYQNRVLFGRTPAPRGVSGITGVCLRPPMSISITTATITRSGCCTAWLSPTPCPEAVFRKRVEGTPGLPASGWPSP